MGISVMSCVNADGFPLYGFGACNFLFDSLIFQSGGFQILVKVLGVLRPFQILDINLRLPILYCVLSSTT